VAKVQFFKQKMIDDWVAEGKASFDGVTLEVLVGNKGTYHLEPATMFLDTQEGEDQHKLKGKVLTQKHLEGLGADVYLDSALIGEIAYKVEPGFLVISGQAPKVEVQEAQEKQSEEVKEEDLLADIMLKTLTDNSSS